MATLASTLPNLYGWGTYLDTTFDPSQASGGADAAGGAQDFLTRLQQYDPTAHFETVTGSEGQPEGQKIVYDPSNPVFQQFKSGQIETNPVYSYGTDKNQANRADLFVPQAQGNMGSVFGQYTPEQNFNSSNGATDLGFWGPLAVSLITGGAAMGLLPGFAGMSDAAAQGLVGSATGGMGAGDASFLGLSGSKLPNAFQGLGQQLTADKPNGGSLLSSLLPFLGSGLGLPSYATSLGRLALSQANKPSGGG